MGNNNHIKDIYLRERKKLINEISLHLCGVGEASSANIKAIASVFWQYGYTLQDSEIVPFSDFFLANKSYFKNINILGLYENKNLLEKVTLSGEKYLRLQSSTNWILDLTGYENFDSYFMEFSKKKRKNLRWQLNTYDKNNFTISKIETEKDFESFFEIYGSQFKQSSWLQTENKKSLIDIFTTFQKIGKNHSFILKDKDNKLVSGCLGYFAGDTYNLYMLARVPEMYDNLSPSNYLVFKVIKEMLENKTSELFVFGPGYYKYKKTFKATSYPIYNYEKIALKNIYGILKLLNKYRKIKRRRE